MPTGGSSWPRRTRPRARPSWLQAQRMQQKVRGDRALAAAAALLVLIVAIGCRRWMPLKHGAETHTLGSSIPEPKRHRTATKLDLEKELEQLVREKNCAPILVRLAWHDAATYSTGNLKGGCPNAGMRFEGGGEGDFEANNGLRNFANKFLGPIADKYCPTVCSIADLWVLAANVAVRVSGGPDIPTRFGRPDAKSIADAVTEQEGRFPDGDKGVDHLRAIFYPKGFNDQQIVALSGGHTLGRCYLNRSGFDGFWTDEPYKFDNSYFQDMLKKSYVLETTAKGCPQHRNPETGTMMLISDLALLDDPSFRPWVEKYAEDQSAFFTDYAEAWTKLTENGVEWLF